MNYHHHIDIYRGLFEQQRDEMQLLFMLLVVAVLVAAYSGLLRSLIERIERGLLALLPVTWQRERQWPSLHRFFEPKTATITLEYPTQLLPGDFFAKNRTQVTSVTHMSNASSVITVRKFSVLFRLSLWWWEMRQASQQWVEGVRDQIGWEAFEDDTNRALYNELDFPRRAWIPYWLRRRIAQVEVALSTLIWCACYAVCCFSSKGHDYEDESWAGPESGGMGARCKRCGHSFSTTLY